jgi:hypothetical protein
VDPDKIILGIGFGKNKRASKSAAAAKVLACLIPGLKFNKNHIVIADE